MNLDRKDNNIKNSIPAESLLADLHSFQASKPQSVNAVTSFLQELVTKLAKLNIPNNPAFDAVYATILAFDYYDRDPRLEAWCNWQKRVRWIELEVKSLSIQLDQHEQERLHSFRDYYQHEDGLPLNLEQIYNTSISRTNLAWARSTLYEAGVGVALAIANWPNFDSNQLILDLARPLSVFESKQAIGELQKKVSNLVQEETRESFAQNLREIYAKVLDHVNNLRPEFQYGELLKLSEAAKLELTQNLLVCAYDKHCLPNNDIWAAFKKTMENGKKRSSTYVSIPIEEMQELLEHNNAKLITLAVGDNVVFYGVLIIRDNNFLDRTLSKLKQFSELELSKLPVHSWLYMVAGDSQAAMELRKHKIDWFALFMEIVGDVAINDNVEDVLGVVEASNPSNKSNARIGAYQLGNKEFISDGGEPAYIFRKPLYS